MRVLVKEHPRSIALVSGEHVLILRYFFNSQSNDERPKCIVEFARVDEIKDFEEAYYPLSSLECFGFLGIINIQNEVYLCTITRKAQVASPRPGETVFRIYGVEFHCLTRPDWDFVTLDSYGYAIETQSNGYQDSKAPNIEHPCTTLKKLLSSGTFYYSTDFDLTSVLQDRGPESKRKLTVDTIDESFMWNNYMMSELIKFRTRLPNAERAEMDQCQFLTTVIRGFAGTVGFRLDSQRSAQLTIISRQSSRKAGTRFNARGVDDDGNVANFVETETVLHVENEFCFGYSQIRGSVPVFWEQDANLMNANRISITRSVEATQPAFNRHFEGLIQRFGIIHVVNLLNVDKSSEFELTQRYDQHIREAAGPRVGLTKFDFHAEVAGAGGYTMASKIIPRLQDQMEEFGFYSCDPASGRDEREQIGVFRTNCLDCLDRTNMVQQLISKEAIEMFLELHHVVPGPELWNKHNFLWADNGDQLSQIYAGTGALKTSFTRSGKMGLAGALADVTKSVGRLYINNFMDKGRQNTIDVLLGKGEDQLQVLLHDPINDYVTTEVQRRRNEFSSTKNSTIFAGTFNLNGKMAEDDLAPWLFSEGVCDVYLVGFQEVVDLTAQQIINADTNKKVYWERQVGNCLCEQDQFVLLRSEQLVGTVLMLYVRKPQVEHIKNVEGALKKTGLGGMAGNKGGCAVSFMFNNTSFCFITAHLAAGLNNVDERHNDYKVLSNGLRFSRGRRIKDHDTVFWLGDFNYRIDLPNDQVRAAIKRQDWQLLLDRDQLNKQMFRGMTFPYYQEAAIAFPPTYKFDNGTDVYDSSERQRVPAWTDRVLSRGQNLKQLSYGCAQLLFSDHRPVYATFNAEVLVVDEKRKQELTNELYDKRKAELGDTNEIVNLIDLNENMLAHGLPPPSSDQKKWWIAGGQSAKVSLNPPPGSDQVINPSRHANPFSAPANAQPDFVPKPPLPPRPAMSTISTPPVMTQAANSKGRSPPSVPRKPVSLKSTSSGESSTTPQLPPRANTISATTSPPPPPPPRKSTSSSTPSLLDDDSHDDQGSQAQADNIGWTPLKPQ